MQKQLKHGAQTKLIVDKVQGLLCENSAYSRIITLLLRNKLCSNNLQLTWGHNQEFQILCRILQTASLSKLLFENNK